MIIHILAGIFAVYMIVAIAVAIGNSCNFEDAATCFYRGLFWGPRLSRDIFRLALKDFKGN